MMITDNNKLNRIPSFSLKNEPLVASISHPKHLMLNNIYAGASRLIS